MQAVDQLPQSARLDGATLIVMNAKGQELWRKTFPEGISRQFYENGLATRMWIGDLNGKGHSVKLFIHQPMDVYRLTDFFPFNHADLFLRPRQREMALETWT